MHLLAHFLTVQLTALASLQQLTSAAGGPFPEDCSVEEMVGIVLKHLVCWAARIQLAGMSRLLGPVVHLALCV
jgi:hypothetical protein